MTLSPIIELITQNAIPIAAGIVGISFLIGFHELGHFLFCKLFNIRTPSFSIGFGPKIFSRQIGDTLFSISAIPLGGYVEIAGAAEVGQGEQVDAYATDEQSFIKKPYYQKLLVMLGGIMFNLLFAYAAFILLFSMGIPKSAHFFPLNTHPIIETIAPESPAYKGNLAVNDMIIAVDNKAVDNNVLNALKAIKEINQENSIITVKRGDELINLPITMNEGNPALGVTFKSETIAPQTFSLALKKGIEATHTFISQTVQGFKQLFIKRNLKQMAGPIAIIGMIGKSAHIGFRFFIFLLAIISINLAILNLIPLPIMDGGQILFYTIEAVIGRPLPIKVKEYIHIACWLFFIGLTLYLSAHDIMRIVQGYLVK